MYLKSHFSLAFLFPQKQQQIIKNQHIKTTKSNNAPTLQKNNYRFIWISLF
ncbi:hypothetical protein C8C83_3536 [Flavobacterium sp. 90]|nr:hypothetical protein C8C82_3854 [Flavobacterium sp. 81]TCK55562.1 hypothetical protein C8C83_3536 [Flavobacterium sp. 90]